MPYKTPPKLHFGIKQAGAVPLIWMILCSLIKAAISGLKHTSLISAARLSCSFSALSLHTSSSTSRIMTQMFVCFSSQNSHVKIFNSSILYFSSRNKIIIIKKKTLGGFIGFFLLLSNASIIKNVCRQILSFSICSRPTCLHIPAQPLLYLSVSSYMTRGQPPQDQIFFLLNDGFIRQISCSSDSEPSVIEIYPCVNSLASHTGSRAMEGCHCGLPSKYELEMSADLGDLLVHTPP